ncbi:MAG: patatin-like phospholipase family protein [Actinomycetota bacterium]
MTTAFVLGGGGHLGAHEVGMLRALHERGIRPDVIVGTSIGALNGAAFATTGDGSAIDRLAETWTSIDRSGVLDNSFVERLKTLWSTKTHLYDNDRFRRLVADAVGTDSFDDLAVPFECVAASIERSSAVYLSSGSLVDAILASSAVPGLLPPVEIDGEHHLDGGLVASIPLDRAIRRGASTVYVLQVGRIEDPLTAPTKPWEVAMIAFEISRRHRFAEAMRDLPDGVAVHVLPTGDAKSFNDLSQYGGTTGDEAKERIEQSYRATGVYLDERDDP